MNSYMSDDLLAEHTVIYDKQHDYILIEYHGPVDVDVVETLRLQAIGLMKQHNCFKTLTNLRGGSFDFSTMDIYEMPESAARSYDEHGIDSTTLKRALLVYNLLGSIATLETISKQQGQQVKVFDDIEEAEEWLNEQ